MTVKLRAVRALGETFDGRFFDRDARFWPLARAAQSCAGNEDWPLPEAYGAAFGERTAPVRFVTTAPRRRRRGPVALEDAYDGRIVRGEVPTRARCWHDFLNALVWVTFPAAKMALHRRQWALYQQWAQDGAAALPNARTRPQDALALVDEGGVIELRAGSRARTVPFGHALYEGLVMGTRAMAARVVTVDVGTMPERDEDALACADDALALRLETTILPEQLQRVAF